MYFQKTPEHELLLLQHIKSVHCHRPGVLGSTCFQPLNVSVRVQLTERSFFYKEEVGQVQYCCFDMGVGKATHEELVELLSAI